ncbi:MAG: thiolase family protein [Candidatus Paceibacterota bacterium]
MRRLAIAGTVRTPIGAFCKSLKDAPAEYLLAICFRRAIKRSGIPIDRIDEVIAGNVGQPMNAPNITRVAALLAGVPKEVTGFTVQRNCASGLQAMASAMDMWAAGRGKIFLVGGTENMSRIPYVIEGARSGLNLGHTRLTDGLWQGLTDPIVSQMMGRTAENVVKKYGITREMQDRFAVDSHRKAFEAREEGRFDSQIVPVEIERIFNDGKSGNKHLADAKIFGKDECINGQLSSIEQKAQAAVPLFMNPDITAVSQNYPDFSRGKIKIETSYYGEGTVTAFNSCPLSDGAAAMVLIDADLAEELGVEPEAYFVDYDKAGCGPDLMGEAPIYAIPRALERANIPMGEVDLFEINEAFAGQMIACRDALGITDEKLNVWGGAIALGHPVGASGAILSVKAVDILKAYERRYAVVSLCVGGGQALCGIIERAK